MKKLIALLLICVLCLSVFASCSSKKDEPEPDTKAVTQVDSGVQDSETKEEESTEPEETGQMTLYYSHSTEWADPIIEEFMETTGIKVELVQGGTSDLVAKIRAEGDNPQADVLWGGVVDTYYAAKDLLQPYESKEIAYLKEVAIDEERYYHGFDLGPMVMIYNTKLVSKEEAPTKWADLLDPKWKGKIACADPTSSSSSYATIMAIIHAYGKDDGKGYEFVEKLVKNLDGKILSSSSGTYKGVADGEYLIGMTYEEAALRYKSAGADIEIVYPEEGTTASPSGVGIVKNCKNLASARKFVDFILSKEVQSQLGAIYRRTVRKDVEDPDTMTPFSEIAFVDYDMKWSAEHEAEFKDKWRSFVTEN
ncbi:MAG TPA: extracellular solute-binding protein [Clostridiaceae bacterium]|nr:extracellular solute-binding protein [Clostridiaceae bacterium]